MNERPRIPFGPEEFNPELMQGFVPDGQHQGVDEFAYPDYPGLPYPNTVERWDYNNDPLIHNDELTQSQEVWDPEDPHAPWREPH